MKPFIHRLKLNEESAPDAEFAEFARKVNNVSELFAAMREPDLSEEEQKKRWQAFYEAKLSLKMGQ